MDLLSLDKPLTFISLTVTAESDAKLSDWTSIVILSVWSSSRGKLYTIGLNMKSTD